jgi:hypothetical protein
VRADTDELGFHVGERGGAFGGVGVGEDLYVPEREVAVGERGRDLGEVCEPPPDTHVLLGDALIEVAQVP